MNFPDKLLEAIEKLINNTDIIGAVQLETLDYFISMKKDISKFLNLYYVNTDDIEKLK